MISFLRRMSAGTERNSKRLICPEFYPKFSCKADACTHTCCAGWEIDIDREAMARYRKVPGEFGKELRDAISEDAEGFHFNLVDDRCPLLDRDGLCRVIKNLGEEALCEICTLHPRFYGRLGGAELMGLGLSCEQVCELLLAEDRQLLYADSMTEKSYPIHELFALLGMEMEREQTLYLPNPDAAYYEKILSAFRETEPIDAEWVREMDELYAGLDRVVQASRLHQADYGSLQYSRIFSYILYRQLDRIADAGVDVVLAYARMCTEFVFLTESCRAEEDLAACVRRFSEQIEYSDRNVDILFERV